MAISIEKAVPSDAALILDYLKQVGGETDNLTFGAEGHPFSAESEAEGEAPHSSKPSRGFHMTC